VEVHAFHQRPARPLHGMRIGINGNSTGNARCPCILPCVVRLHQLGVSTCNGSPARCVYSCVHVTVTCLVAPGPGAEVTKRASQKQHREAGQASVPLVVSCVLYMDGRLACAAARPCLNLAGGRIAASCRHDAKSLTAAWRASGRYCEKTCCSLHIRMRSL